jgi:hypothetical protein
MNYNQCKAQGGTWDKIKERCHIKPTDTKEKYSFSKIAIAFLIICGLGAATILATEIGTITHEFAGHTFIAKLFGCETNWHSDTYTGQTSFENCMLMKKTDTVCDFDNQCNDGKTSTMDRCLAGVCVYENKAVNILIGISAITLVFFASLALWLFFNKDSLWRVLAIFMMLYSCIPSAFPILPGSDMAYVISQGFPAWIAWILYVLMSGIFMWLLINEVTDRPFFKRLFE